MFFLLRTTLPGVARRLLTFLVSPRKVSKRSDRWVIAPFGGSRRRQAQIGKGKQLAALRHFSLLFPIYTRRHRLLSSGQSAQAARLRHRAVKRAEMLARPSSQRTLGSSGVRASLNRFHDAGFQLSLERHRK